MIIITIMHLRQYQTIITKQKFETDVESVQGGEMVKQAELTGVFLADT
jgi:hypothetical protein